MRTNTQTYSSARARKSYACSKKSLLNYNALDGVICVRVFSFCHTPNGTAIKEQGAMAKWKGVRVQALPHADILVYFSALSAPAINSFSEKCLKYDFIFAIRLVVSSTKVSYRVVAKVMKRAYFAF